MTGEVLSGSTSIPVRNLWLLMLYASRLYASNSGIRGAGAETRPDDLPDLVAEILADAVDRRLQRTLSAGYVDRRRELTRVRGRIDILSTEAKHLLSRGQVACRFTDLAVDNPRNQLIHAGIAVASRIVHNHSLAHRCRQLAGKLRNRGITPVMFDATAAEAITLGRNDRTDLDAVNAARLLLRMNIPNEEYGSRHRTTPVRDPKAVRRLYEAAVRGLYQVALPPPWRVNHGETVHRWPVTERSPGALAILPVMRTDIVIESPDRRIIVETKFADALKPNQFGIPRLSRNHVFQLYGYVQSQSAVDVLAHSTEGVLLYPVVGREIDEFVVIQGHRYRFATVDLSGSATSIRDRLLSIVD